MMEDLPFFCGWGWDFLLSLEKEFEGAAGVILRWIIFCWVVKLPRLHDAQLWMVFSFNYCSMALCMILRDSSSLVSLLLFVTSAQNFIMLGTLSSSCGAVILFQDIFFKMAFIHCFVERVESLRMVIHSDRVELLYCFVWNYREPGNMFLLEMAMNLLLCGFRLFMFCWTRYQTDLEQMLKKERQNIRQNRCWMLETSCEEDLQPEGAHYHYSETVILLIKFVNCLEKEKTTTKFWPVVAKFATRLSFS